jgi:hypothetical protein
MRSSIRDDPKHWRERAEKARALSEQLTDPVSKNRMLRAAEDYDRLAEYAQRRVTRLGHHDP